MEIPGWSASKAYVMGFIICLFIIPQFIIIFRDALNQSNSSIYFHAIIFTINVIIFYFVWSYNSTPEIPLIEGLCLITNKARSGCLNITILYIIPLLFLIYVALIINVILGVIKGRKYSKSKWLKLVREGSFF